MNLLRENFLTAEIQNPFIGELLKSQPLNLPRPAPITMKLATTPEEKRQCYQLRYQAFVEEMGQLPPNANHFNKTITDARDENSILLGAFNGQEAIATCLINSKNLLDLPDHWLFDLEKNLKAYSGRVCVLSKLVIKSEHRGGSLTPRFCKFIFPFMLKEAVVSFIGCDEKLGSFYEKLGFQKFSEAKPVPGFGKITPFFMHNFDETHFLKKRSILLPILKKYLVENQEPKKGAHA